MLFRSDVGNTCINLAANMHEPGIAQRQFASELGQHELDALELYNLLARLLATIDVGHRVFKSRCGNTESMGTNRWTRLIKRRQQKFQPLTRSPQQIGFRDSAVVERERRRR